MYVENDCEDQGFTDRKDGCFACLPDFDKRGKPVRPKIVKKRERGFLLWACERCGGNYGIIRSLHSRSARIERNDMETKMTQCEADEMEARTKRIHNALMAEGAQKIDELRAENAELRTVLARAQALRGDLLGQLGYVPECVLDFCNRAREAIRPH